MDNLSGLDTLLRQILGRLDAIEQRLTSIENKQDDFHGQIEALNDRFDAIGAQLEKRVEALEDRQPAAH